MQNIINNTANFIKLTEYGIISSVLYYANKPENMSKGEWTVTPFNPNPLPTKQLEAINIIDEMVHKSGQGTFFRQDWFATRLDVCKRTAQYWINKFRCLGIIKVERILHNGKWINSYTVTEEFSKYKCPADGILRTCTKQDHSECVRPQVDYTCTSCHRFQAGLSIEQQHAREIDTLKSSFDALKQDYEEKIAELEQELAKTKAFRASKAKVIEERKLSKSQARENFLSKLSAEQAAVIYSYEAITGRKFDVEKDLRAFNLINQHSPITAIIGILQTAINSLAIEEKAQGKKTIYADINQAIKKATIYSLQYCVQQVERVGKEFRSAFNQVKDIVPSRSIMGYLGSTMAAFDAKTSLELLGIIKHIPEKLLGGKSEIEYLLGVYASKVINLQIKAGLIDLEEKEAIFQEYFSMLLIEVNLSAINGRASGSDTLPHDRVSKAP